MKNLPALGALLLMSFQLAHAQTPCGNDLLRQQWIKSNPSIETKIAAEKKAWQTHNDRMATSKMIVAGTDTSYEIPVVVHVIHTGGAVGSINNPSDGAIDSFITYINKTWSATWPYYFDTLHGGTRVPIKFVLAKRSPDCGVTNGINRVNGNVLSGYNTYGVCPYGTVSGPSDSAVKSLSLWPTRDYFNIWLVNNIENGMLGGYAPWPWFTGADLIDGAVVLAQYAVPLFPPNYYVAGPHELGHSFGLYHTFQDGCGTGDCVAEGDEVCDTEPHVFSSMACETGDINSCTGVLFDSVEFNIMNYSTCPAMLTKGQKKRILYTMKNYRMGLVNSMGVTAPDASFVGPLLACKPGVVNVGNGNNNGPCNIAFANMVTSSSGYADDGRLAYIDRTCIQQGATVVKGSSYQLSVSTIEGAQNVNAWIDYNNDGVFQTTERVFSHSGSMADEVHSGMIAIPSAAVVTGKNLRMRIQADNTTLGTACDNLQNGQTEDYTVLIKASSGITPVAAAANRINVFPNPATDLVTIETTVPASFIVCGMDGKVVAQENTGAVINLSRLASGLYFIKAYDKSNQNLIGVQKLLKVNQ